MKFLKKIRGVFKDSPHGMTSSFIVPDLNKIHGKDGFTITDPKGDLYSQANTKLREIAKNEAVISPKVTANPKSEIFYTTEAYLEKFGNMTDEPNENEVPKDKKED